MTPIYSPNSKNSRFSRLSFFLVGYFAASLFVFASCNPFYIKKEEDDPIRNLVLLGIAGGQCSSIESCFRKFARTTDEGAALLIIDRNNRTLYDLEEGTIANNRHQVIFSGSKWITAIVIQRLIQRTGSSACHRSFAGPNTLNPPLNLDSTTGQVLGWTSRSNITMRHLLAFTSGLDDPSGGAGQEICIFTLPTNASDVEKDACIAKIRDNTKKNPPGEAFVYNSNHMAVAQRMAEIACGEKWSKLYKDEVVTPLGFHPDRSVWAASFGLDGSPKGDGSLAGAYGLITSPREYSRVMLALLRQGLGYNGTSDVPYLAPDTVVEILSDQSQGARIGFSQFAIFGYQWRYGLGNWRYCSKPAQPSECDKDLISHSVGVNGFFPWLDRNRGYFGIVSVNNLGRRASLTNLPSNGVNSLFFAETIRPMIHRELE